MSIHTSAHMSIYTSAHSSIHICAHMYTHESTHMCIYTCVFICLHTCLFTCLQTCLLACFHTCLFTCPRRCQCLCQRTRMCTRLHMRLCMCPCTCIGKTVLVHSRFETCTHILFSGPSWRYRQLPYQPILWVLLAFAGRGHRHGAYQCLKTWLQTCVHMCSCSHTHVMSGLTSLPTSMRICDVICFRHVHLMSRHRSGWFRYRVNIWLTDDICHNYICPNRACHNHICHNYICHNYICHNYLSICGIPKQAMNL